MTADLTVTCGYCGSDDLACRSCDDDIPAKDDPAWTPVIDPRVRDSILRRHCTCHIDTTSGHWLLCAWHQGYAAALTDEETR